MQRNTLNRRYFQTPFSADYWRQAFGELKNTRSLVFAALILALRIAMKPLRIPVATDVNITFGFIVNALGSMVYGPVVALLGGAVSDTLGYLVSPNGVYFFPFILLEMGGSFIFALFLYSTDITPVRLILSKFSVNLFVNILLNEPIMVVYYRDVLHLTTYQPFVLVRIIKNIVMLPLESVILMIVFRAVIPALTSVGYRLPGKMELNYTKKHIILLIVMFVIGAGAVMGFQIYDYNNKSFSADYTAPERLEKNREMNAWVTEQRPELKPEETVTIIESARSAVGSKEMTYELAIYRIDMEKYQAKHDAAEADIAAGKEGAKAYTTDTLNGYSKSKAAKDDTLIRIGTGTAVTDKNTMKDQSIGDRISMEITMSWGGEDNP